MLFETLSQPVIALYILIVGFLCGIIFDLNNFIWLLSKKDKVLRIFLDIASTLLAFAIFFILISNIAFGEFRIYQIILFVLAIYIYRKIFGKIFAKLNEKCYIKLTSFIRKICKHFCKKEQKIDDVWYYIRP